MKKIFIISIFVIIFAIGFCVSFQTDNTIWIVYVSLFIVIFGIPLALYEDKLDSKEDPLSIERINSSLRYIVSEGYGTKSSFIGKNSEEMYNYFLTHGVIHELRFYTNTEYKNQKVWEITVRGKQWAKDKGIE